MYDVVSELQCRQPMPILQSACKIVTRKLHLISRFQATLDWMACVPGRRCPAPCRSGTTSTTTTVMHALRNHAATVGVAGKHHGLLQCSTWSWSARSCTRAHAWRICWAPRPEGERCSATDRRLRVAYLMHSSPLCRSACCACAAPGFAAG